MIQLSEINSVKMNAYQHHSAGTGKFIELLIQISVIVGLNLGATFAQAQAPNKISAQESYLNKLLELQKVIDSADVDIQNQLLSAQANISILNSQRIQQNIGDDQKASQEILKLFVSTTVTAGEWRRLPGGEKVERLTDLALSASEVGKTLVERGQANAEALKAIGVAKQRYAAAATLLDGLRKLQGDQARLAAEGQKAGLLPNINYNPKTGTFTVTSPQRTNQQITQNSPPPKQSATPTSASAVRAAPSALPTSPDPLALAILYETVLVYEADLVALNKSATRARVDAFAKCMIEHRTTNTVRPNELWEYLTRSAQLLREKGVVGVYWPPAQRERELRPRAKEFEFRLSQKTLRDMSTRPVNALFPGTVRGAGFTYPEMTLSIQAMGFSDFQTCTKIPRLNNNPPRTMSSDDDDN